MKFCLSIILFFLTNHHGIAEDGQIFIGHFSTGKMQHWETKVFSGQTFYNIELLDQRHVLKATSQSSASGLVKKQRVDLHKTPYLNWSWRIDNRLAAINEQSKEGDDYAARIYVVIDGGWTFWQTKAVNYVWSSNSKKGKVWFNAFAGESAMMLALRSNDDKLQTWYHEKRNILVDLKQLFGEEYSLIDAIAIMTDTDNSKSHATAYYGDIYFSAN